MTSRTTGLPYVLTAGHCLDPFPNHESDWYGYFAGGDAVKIGPNHSPYISGANGDAGLITVDTNNSLWWLSSLKPKPWVFIQASGTGSTRRTEEYRIRKVLFSNKGQTLCWSGATSGAHCGTVLNPSSKRQRFGVLHTCGTAGGDSGAPVVSAGTARGLVIGYTREEPCNMYYQSAKLAQDLLNVNVKTSSP